MIPDFEQAASALIRLARDLHARGRVPATSGNFSLRLADGDLAITASGKDKSALRQSDILRLDPQGRVRDDGRPSAETGLHLQLYHRDPQVGAVLHTHSLYSVAASIRTRGGVRFEGLELLKAFPGIDSHVSALELPVFDNDQDIEALATRVERHMDSRGQGHGYLIRGHGLYTWGGSLDDARRHLEALEFLLEYHVRFDVPAPARGGA